MINQLGQRAVNQRSADRAKYTHYDVLYLDCLLWAWCFFSLSTSLKNNIPRTYRLVEQESRAAKSEYNSQVKPIVYVGV